MYGAVRKSYLDGTKLISLMTMLSVEDNVQIRLKLQHLNLLPNTFTMYY